MSLVPVLEAGCTQRTVARRVVASLLKFHGELWVRLQALGSRAER